MTMPIQMFYNFRVCIMLDFSCSILVNMIKPGSILTECWRCKLQKRFVFLYCMIMKRKFKQLMIINSTNISKSNNHLKLRGKRFTVCTEITIILGTVWFTIRGGRLRYKRYDAHFLKKKSSVEHPFSSFGDHLINILRKVNRLIYAFKIN
jgi:hypothetical protein